MLRFSVTSSRSFISMQHVYIFTTFMFKMYADLKGPIGNLQEVINIGSSEDVLSRCVA